VQNVDDEDEFDGLATDASGIASVFPTPFDSNLLVTPGFEPLATNAPFTVERDIAGLPAAGVIVAEDREGLTCEFPLIDLPSRRDAGATEGWAQGVKLYEGKGGRLAFVLDQTEGLQIFNLSVSSGVGVEGGGPIGSFTPDASLCPLGSYSDDLDLYGDTAFLATGQCGLLAVDVSNPSSPQLLWQFAPPGWAKDVAVYAGNGEVIAYVADYSEGLRIVRVSGENAPEDLGVVGFGDGLEGRPIAVWVKRYGTSVSDVLVYVATTHGLFIIDPEAENPVVGSVLTNPDNEPISKLSTIPQDVVVYDGRAYVPAWRGGLKIYDVSDPTNPTEVPGDPIDTDLAFYKVAVSDYGRRLFVTEGLCGLAIFAIDGADLDEVMPSPIPIGGEVEDCTDPNAGGSWAWAIDEQHGLVAVTRGVLDPRGGGFELLEFLEIQDFQGDFVQSLPRPGAVVLLGAGVLLPLLAGRRRARR
jgi:hypothetical protein